MKTARYLAKKVQDATGNAIAPAFFNQVAQIAHFGAWFFLMTVCATLSNRLLGRAWLGVEICAPANVVYAIWHEFFWDPVHENAATRGSDLEDFGFLLLGGLAGLAVYALLIR